MPAFRLLGNPACPWIAALAALCSCARAPVGPEGGPPAHLLPAASPVLGIVVTYASADAGGRDDLRRRLGLRLAYVSANGRIEILRPVDPLPPDSPAAAAAAWDACRALLSGPGVDSCEPDHRYFRANAPVEVLPDCFTHPAPLAAAADLERIRAHVACDPFETRLQGGVLPAEESPEFGRLTPLWAQDLVGADLARRYLDRWDEAQPGLASRIVPVGVVDGGITLSGVQSTGLTSPMVRCRARPRSCPAITPDAHGTAVANLIVSSAGSGARARLARGIDGLSTGGLVRAADAMTAAGPDRPEVINFSVFLRDPSYGDAARAAMERMAAHAILVRSSGNDHPQPLHRFTTEPPGIVVGSTAPNGLLSDFSQEGDAVTITAPSHHEIVSMAPDPADGLGTLSTFGGTSGATPLVTGAISNAQSLLEGITLEETRLLLRHTAIHTAGFRPRRPGNGAGALNAYKMVRVAAKLRETPPGWPANRALLDQAGTYDFRTEAAELTGEAKTLLDRTDCVAARLVASKLRQAFFLDQDNPEIRALLAGLYRSAGYESQAQYVEARSTGETLARVTDPSVRFTHAVRAGQPLDAAAEALYASIPGAQGRAGALGYALDVHGPGARSLLLRAFSDPDRDVRLAWGEGFARRSPETRLMIARAALGASGGSGPTGEARAEIRAAAVVHSMRSLEPASERLAIAERALADPSPLVRFRLARMLSTGITGADCPRILGVLARDASARVRAAAGEGIAECR